MSAPAPRAAAPSPWPHVLRAAAALAAAMGVGRFVYTPILPLMHEQAGLTTGAGANLATANYLGYLAGAVVGSAAPRLVRSPALLRASLAALVATLALMPLTHSTTVWLTLRFVAGLASALVFVTAATSLLGRLRGHPAHLPGWSFGGVGTGIALSGVLVLILRSVADWRAAWWASAALAAVLSVAAWTLRTEAEPERGPVPLPARAPAGSGPPDTTGPVTATLRAHETRPGTPRTREPAALQPPRTHRWFTLLFVSYSLEGVGYIVAGTFLVAAIGQGSPGWIGSGAWVLVGLAAIPASALWTSLGKWFTRPGLLATALAVQAAGIALPALVGNVAAALVAAVLFGGTFLGVSTLTLATGNHLRFPRSVALLTAGYSVGQILGPVAVTPLLHNGYREALLLAAAVTAAAALAAVALRVGFPHRMPEPDSVPLAPAPASETAEARSGPTSSR